MPKTNFLGAQPALKGLAGRGSVIQASPALKRGGSGYGIVEVNPTDQTVTLRTKSWDQGVLTSYTETMAASVRAPGPVLRGIGAGRHQPTAGVPGALFQK